MGKKKATRQVRIPESLMRDVDVMAPLFGEEPHEYVTRLVREARARDWPRALKEMAKRSKDSGTNGSEE